MTVVTDTTSTPRARRAARPVLSISLAASLLIVAAVVFKGSILGEAYFKPDDYEIIVRSTESGLSWDYLTRVHDGQLMPGALAVAWLLARIAPYSWALTSAVSLLGYALAGFALYRMLVVLFGRRWAILVPLTVFLFAATTLPMLAWWSTALSLVPLLIALPMAVAAHVTHLRDGRLRPALHALGWIVLGLAFSLKAVVIPVLLFVLTAAYFRDRLRSNSPVWGLYGVALAGYVALYLALGTAQSQDDGGLPAPLTIVGLAWQAIGSTFATTLLGGPWRWFASSDWATASPPLLVVIASAVLVAALVIASVTHRRRAGWAWGILLGYLLAACVLPLLITGEAQAGAFVGNDTRYVADAVVVLALCLALAFLPLAGEEAPYLRPLPAVEGMHLAGGVLIGGFLTASLVSSTMFGSYLGARGKHEFLVNAGQSLADAPKDVQIFDRVAPGYLWPPSQQEYAMVSRVVAPLATKDQRLALYLPSASAKGQIFDDEGRLRQVAVEGRLIRPPGKCWKSDGDTISIPLSASLLPGGLIRIGTLSSGQGQATLVVGGARLPVLIQGGLGQVFLTVPGAVTRVQVTEVSKGVTMCFGDVTVGRAVPAP